MASGHVALRVVALATTVASALAAQDSRSPQPIFAPSGRETTMCTGQRVDSIRIVSEAPTVIALQRVPALATLARRIHATTRSEVVRRYLLLSPGEMCSEIRRAESERILRAQPFISESAIYVVPNDSGGVDLEVHTTDETALVFGAAVRGRSPIVTSLLAGNANMGGQGVFGAVGWRYGEGFRSAVFARVTDNQFLGESIVSTLEAERAERGGTWRAEVMRPYYTDLQRVAWHMQAGASKAFVELRRPDALRPAVLLKRDYFDVGGIARIGPPGRLTLLGASITSDAESSGNRLTTGDTGIVHDVGPVPGQYNDHRVARINLLIGVRNITFIRRMGLDALTAVEDVPVGIQIGGLIGRTMHALGSREEDIFASADVYGAATSGIGLVRLQLRGEARRLIGASTWDGVLMTSRLTHNLQWSATHENVMRVEWSATSHQRTPFQLLLGAQEAGIRGFEESPLAGARRLVAHFDERFGLGRPLNLADAGIAVFADVGKQWAGDVPFGTTTPVKGSVGFSILAAIPPRSGRLWRADIAVPLGSGANARWTIRFSNYDRTSFVFREPRDVSDAREPTVPRSIFAWP